MGKNDKKQKARDQREARLERAAREDAEAATDDGIEEVASAPSFDTDDLPGETEDYLPADDEQSREEQAEAVVREAEASVAMTRIQIDVAVNGLPAGQKLTVDEDHPYYASLIKQKMAHVLTDDELEAEG